MFLKKKSKRVKLSQKYNIQKKIRSHNRKQRKEEKKKLAGPNKTGKKNKKKSKTTIHIPNNFPFKSEYLDLINQSKLKHDEESKAKAQLNKQLKQERKQQNLEIDDGPAPKDNCDMDVEINMDDGYESFLNDILAKQKCFSEKNDTNESSLVDITSKFGAQSKINTQYLKDIYRLIEMSDVVIEVLDVRNPIMTRNVSLEDYIVKKQKKLIILLNKIDLVPSTVTEKWLNYFSNSYPCLAFKCVTNSASHKYTSNINVKTATTQIKKNSQMVLGSSALLHLLKNYSRACKTNVQIIVGIFGHPNVGKSSLINSMKKCSSSFASCNSNVAHCSVGGKPGITKKLQTIKINKHMRFIDSPGIIPWNTDHHDLYNLILRNSCDVVNLKNPEEVVESLVARTPKEKLVEIFKIADFNSAKEFLYAVAMRRNKFIKNGIPDYEGTARMVLKECMEGKIKFYTVPPNDEESNLGLSGEIVITDKLSESIMPKMEEILRQHNKNNMNRIGIESMDDVSMKITDEEKTRE